MRDKRIEIERRPHTRPSYPHINSDIFGNVGAKIGNERFLDHISGFRELFKKQCSYELGLLGHGVPEGGLFPFFNDFGLLAEEISIEERIFEREKIKNLRDYYVDYNKNKDIDSNTNSNPPYSLLIIYIPGDFLFNDGKTVGVTNRVTKEDGSIEWPLLILLTDKATTEVLAHEVGHALLRTNKNGDTSDPDPDPDDPSHNRNPGNLMYKEAGNIITPEQCAKFKESSIILRP